MASIDSSHGEKPGTRFSQEIMRKNDQGKYQASMRSSTPKQPTIEQPENDDVASSGITESSSITEGRNSPASIVGWRDKFEHSLMDREDEQKHTLEFLKESKSRPIASPNSILLVTGDSGSGKTRFVQSIQNLMNGGCYLVGKFEYHTRAPYSGFINAIQTFLIHVLQQDPDTAFLIESAVHQEFTAGQISVLQHAIPGLQNVIRQIDDRDAKPKVIEKFGTVLRRFLVVLCNVKSHVVLCLDDLHLATLPSLELLSLLVAECPVRGLTVVATAPRIEISKNLREVLQSMTKTWDTIVVEIALKPLSRMSLSSVLNQAFGSEMTELVEVLLQKWPSGMNFMELLWFLAWAEDGQYLATDAAGKWSLVDRFSLSMEDGANSLSGIVHEELGRHFEGEVYKAWKLAACLESEVDIDLIESLAGTNMGNAMDLAISQGLVQRNEQGNSFMFVNTAVRSTLSSGVLPEQKARLHLKAALTMWNSVEDDQIDQRMFDILGHFNAAKLVIDSMTRGDKVSVVTLCLHAAKHAAALSSFEDAFNVVEFGMNLIDDADWEENYDVALALHNAAVELRISTSRMSDIEEITRPILKHAKSPLEKLTAWCACLHDLGLKGLHSESITQGTAMIRELGFDFPDRISLLPLFAKLVAIKRRLRKMSDERILRLPLLEDPTLLAVLRILHHVILDAISEPQPEMIAYITATTNQITLDHGLSVFAGGAFVGFGMVLVNMKDLTGATRLGKLSITLLHRFGRIEYLPRIYLSYYGVISAFRKPVNECLEPLLLAHQYGSLTGDVQFSIMSGLMHCSLSIEAGKPLRQIERHFHRLYEIVKKNGDTATLSLSLPHIQRLRHYLGLTDDPLSDKGDLMDYKEKLNEAESSKRGKMAIFPIKYSKLQLAYVFNDYHLAMKWSVTQKELSSLPRTLETASASFFRAATLIEMARLNVNRGRNIRQARSTVKTFDRWAQESPHNIVHRFHLLKAELASVLEKNDEAGRHFLCAVSVARYEEDWFTNALASERFALHLLRMDEEDKAKRYLLESLECYEKWGAVAKGKQLRSFLIELGAAFPNEIYSQKLDGRRNSSNFATQY